MPSIGYKVLYKHKISVLLSICLSCPPVNFKNSPEYLTRCDTLMFISLMIFDFEKLSVTSELLFFLISSLISACLMVSAFNILKYFLFPSLQAF